MIGKTDLSGLKRIQNGSQGWWVLVDFSTGVTTGVSGGIEPGVVVVRFFEDVGRFVRLASFQKILLDFEKKRFVVAFFAEI